MLALLPYLRRGERIGVAHLARVLGATPDEIIEDVWTLMMVGVPPYTPDVMIDVAVSEDEAFLVVSNEPPALDRTVRLAAAETRALAAALQSCGVIAGDPLLAKLAAATGVDADPAAMAHLVSSAVAPEGAGTVYVAIARAVNDCEIVEIEYFSAGRGETTTRRIHPYVLENHRGAWYLSAFCELADDDRVFRLDRVNGVTSPGERVDPPAHPPAPRPDLSGRSDLSVAEVLFAPGAAVPADREWPGIETEQRDDGSTLARVPFDGPEWLARRIVARLGQAQALSPAELRSAVATLAATMLAVQDGCA
jgi:predicted DNA-binding transcriptional regulator YafY